MDQRTARILNSMTTAFYRREASSFSDTRQSSWPGWRRCFAAIEGAAEGGSARPRVRLLDLACGNLRFEAALGRALGHADVRVLALDSCDDLVRLSALGEACGSVHVEYRSFDAIEAALAGAGLPEQVAAGACDAAVSFGFLHHVPGQANRERILRALLGAVRPGGVVIVSFWRFLRDEGLAARARTAHERALEELARGTVAGVSGGSLQGSADGAGASERPAADRGARMQGALASARESGGLDLDPGDYLLGWKHETGAYRYCHSFSDGDIDELVCAVSDVSCVIDRFDADGRTENLNTYIVVRKRDRRA